MTIEEARKEIIKGIREIYEEDEAKNISELLLERITNLSRTKQIAKKNEALSASQTEFLDQSIERLQRHEPVQYITHEAWFAGMKFYVDKNVLIPRPETEELVDWVIKEVKNKNSPPAGRAGKFRILDIGTGSGCIAVALKNNLPNAEVWACDISEEALNAARINADSLNATIDFVPLDFLDKEQRKQLPHIDIIVSNPPYVPQKDKNEMKKNVTDHEPAIALFVPDEDPLIFYSAIADFGREKLNEKGSIYVEIHENLGEPVKNLFQIKGYNSIRIKKDLQEKERMIKISLE